MLFLFVRLAVQIKTIPVQSLESAAVQSMGLAKSNESKRKEGSL